METKCAALSLSTQFNWWLQAVLQAYNKLCYEANFQNV